MQKVVWALGYLPNQLALDEQVETVVSSTSLDLHNETLRSRAVPASASGRLQFVARREPAPRQRSSRMQPPFAPLPRPRGHRELPSSLRAYSSILHFSLMSLLARYTGNIARRELDALMCINLVTFLKSLNDADCGGFFGREESPTLRSGEPLHVAPSANTSSTAIGRRGANNQMAPSDRSRWRDRFSGRSLTSAGISKSTLHSQNARHDPLHALLDLEYCK